MRDDFSAAVRQIVANRVNWICSNPVCLAVTSGPQLDPAKSVNIGVAAHIAAASEGGPRFDSLMSPDERKHAANTIWLCQNCAKLIDNDVVKFTTKKLKAWKADAEFAAWAALGKTASRIDSRSADLTSEEIDILCAAADKGDIHVLRMDIGSWLEIAGEHFRDDNDPAIAASYSDALRTLEQRGLAEYDEGMLHVLTGRGFRLARALKESREEYGIDEEDESVLFDSVIKLKADGGFMPFVYELEVSEGVSYEIDCNDPVDFFILDSVAYDQWRNDGETSSANEVHEGKRLIKGEFWPGETAEYTLIIFNPNVAKTRAEAKFQLLESE